MSNMLYGFLIVLIIVIFHIWFTFLPISTGDLGFFYKEQIVAYFNLPFMWEAFRNSGFGGTSFLHQGVYFYNIPLGILGQYLPYGVIERIVWFYPILIIGFFSPFFLARILHLFPSKFYPLTILIYLLNTYFFIIMGGGQLTVVFGYLAIPLAFAFFIDVLRKMTVLKVLLFSIVTSSLFLFDFRYAYIFFVILFIYTIFSFFRFISISEAILFGKKYMILFFVSIFITLGMHAFWLLPYSFYFQSPTTGFTQAYISDDAVKYFSFAQFENAFSLFHPNWPENIFGKVGFMKPEFLLLPILAYLSLFFLKKRDKNTNFILFFALLGIIGAILTTGANEPLGEIYQWLFANIPGFVMFRDPTKWYTLVALSYSVLIPFSIWKIYELLALKREFSIFNFPFSIKSQILNLQNAFLLGVMCYLLMLIAPAWMGKLGGTFKPVVIPTEYIALKDFLISQKNFSRVLWIPKQHRFAFYSDIHPPVDGRVFFNTFDQKGIIKALENKNLEGLLQSSAIRYIVVVDDTQKEIFLKDREYDPMQYTQTVATVKKNQWLHEVKNFGKVLVFEVTNPKEHFYSASPNIQIQAIQINPTEYQLTLQNSKKGDIIIFVESYAKNWHMEHGSTTIIATPYERKFNSFVLQKSGNYTVKVSYQPQSLVFPGLIVTGVTLVMVIAGMGFLALKKKE